MELRNLKSQPKETVKQECKLHEVSTVTCTASHNISWALGRGPQSIKHGYFTSNDKEASLDGI